MDENYYSYKIDELEVFKVNKWKGQIKKNKKIILNKIKINLNKIITNN